MSLKEYLQSNAKLVSQIIDEDHFTDTLTPNFLRDAVREYPLRGGKRLRSALLSWSCGLLGGNPQSARFASAAVEIYHNWTLVHDDIIDNDLTRRNAPSQHIALANLAKSEYRTSDTLKFGQDFAILAGDIQQGWAINMLLRSVEAGVSHKTVLYLIKKLQEHVNRDLISGEALDVEFSYRNITDISKEQVEKMLYMKTGVLLELSAVTGGIIALDKDFPTEMSLSELQENIEADTRLKKLAKFASDAGIAFQLQDDWLGIFGDEKQLGKPIASDISEAKPTILLMETFECINDKKRTELNSFIGKENFSEEELSTIRNIIRESGAEERVTKRAEHLLNKAKQSLEVFDDSIYKTNLLRWADFLITRNS